MCRAQGLTKYPDTSKMIHLKGLFIQRVDLKIDDGYLEAHLHV